MAKRMTFIIALIMCCLIPSTVYAQDYSNDYPNYLPYSGGAYIEVQSSIGRGSIILQNIYKDGYFGFSGSGYNLCNISNSTLTGRFVLQNGTSYTCRFTSFGNAQYYYEQGSTREYRNLNITHIYNTNCILIDDTVRDRGTHQDVMYNQSTFKYTVCCLLFVILIILIFKKGKE